MAELLKPPHYMDFTSTVNVSDNWKKFKQRYEMYMKATEKDKKAEDIQVATLLTMIGEQGMDIYNSFEWREADDKNKINTVLQKFDGYCEPIKNVTFERHKFNTCVQGQMNIDQYVTELRKRLKTREFGELENGLIKDRIICGISENTVRECLLREPDLTLDKALSICRAAEATRQRIQTMSLVEEKNLHAVSSSVDVKHKQKGQRPGQSMVDQRWHNKPQMSSKNIKPSAVCDKCGHSHKPKNCPAFGKTCSSCKKQNHFAKMCRSQRAKKTVQFLGTENDDTANASLFIDAVNSNEKSGFCDVNLIINKNFTTFKIDTGAQTNVMTKSKFDELQKHEKLVPTNVKLTTYSGQSLQVHGKVTFRTKYKRQLYDIQFIVVDDSKYPARMTPLIGLDTSEKMGEN